MLKSQQECLDKVRENLKKLYSFLYSNNNLPFCQMVTKVYKVYRSVNIFYLTFKAVFCIYFKGPQGMMGEYGMLGDRGLPVSNDMESSRALFHCLFILGRCWSTRFCWCSRKNWTKSKKLIGLIYQIIQFVTGFLLSGTDW
jgi:hypothetical protein